MTKDHGVKHCRTKHIDIRYHFVRKQSGIVYRYVSSSNNPANVMTKPLAKTQHVVALHLIGTQIEGAY